MQKEQCLKHSPDHSGLVQRTVRLDLSLNKPKYTILCIIFKVVHYHGQTHNSAWSLFRIIHNYETLTSNSEKKNLHCIAGYLGNLSALLVTLETVHMGKGKSSVCTNL